MTGKEPLPEYNWKVALRKGGKLTVRAAYAQHGAGAVMNVPGDSPAPAVLKDAGNKIVFLAPAECVAYVRRGKPAGKLVVPLPPAAGLTPAQIRDLQDALNRQGAAITLFPGKRDGGQS